jgi:hypothetical protein
MGSHAYGTNTPESDYDIRGVFTPPKVMIFPGTQGLLVGFDRIPQCEHWVSGKQKIVDNAGKEFEFDLHNITKFFRLAMGNNPNQLDLLFVRETQISQISSIGRMLIDNRHIFLSKLVWKKYRGYASDQLRGLNKRKKTGKRAQLVEKFGYDVKFGCNCMRLLTECEQILFEGNLDLTRDNGELKSIRNGEWSFERLEKEFEARKLAIEARFHQSTLPELPDPDKVRSLLMDCLEHHYGSLSAAIVRPDESVRLLREIDAVLERGRKLIHA